MADLIEVWGALGLKGRKRNSERGVQISGSTLEQPEASQKAPRESGGIQYAANFRFYHGRLGILDRPLSQATTKNSRHCEERSDEAIHATAKKEWIASLRSQ
jgi:hypothetical protein